MPSRVDILGLDQVRAVYTLRLEFAHVDAVHDAKVERHHRLAHLEPLPHSLWQVVNLLLGQFRYDVGDVNAAGLAEDLGHDPVAHQIGRHVLLTLDHDLVGPGIEPEVPVLGGDELVRVVRVQVDVAMAYTMADAAVTLSQFRWAQLVDWQCVDSHGHGAAVAAPVV